MPKNCWLGTTITRNGFPVIPFSANHINFVSIEPILECINLQIRHNPEKLLDWIIVGAETGNRKAKVIPELYWIMNLVAYAHDHNIPIWLKENLQGIWPNKLIWPGELIQELPRKIEKEIQA
ncbi:hypothetical protein ES705_16436 [subsurface metagenome]